MLKKTLTLILLFSVTSCSFKSECKSKYIVLNEKDFAVPVIADAIFSPMSNSPQDSAGRSFYYEDGGGKYSVLHTVEKYSFEIHASENYATQEEQSFRTNNYEGSWQLPADFDATNISASQYHIACGNVKPFSHLTCRYVAQYENYLTYFAVEIPENGTEFFSFLDAVNKVDSRLMQCIK